MRTQRPETMRTQRPETMRAQPYDRSRVRAITYGNRHSPWFVSYATMAKWGNQHYGLGNWTYEYQADARGQARPTPRGKGAGFDYPETPCTQCGRPMNPAERMLGPVCGRCTRENHERVTSHRPARPRPTHRPRPRGAHPVVRTLADLKRLPLGTRVYVSYPGALIHGNLGSTAIAPISGVLKSLASVRASFMEWRTEEGPKAGTLSRLTYPGTKVIPTAGGFDLAEDGRVFASYTFAE